MTGEVRFIGPFDDIAKKKWDRMQARKTESLQEIDELRKMLKRKPDLQTFIEEDIAHEQRLIAIIDYHLPDEATRRSPFYDPHKPIKTARGSRFNWRGSLHAAFLAVAVENAPMIQSPMDF